MEDIKNNKNTEMYYEKDKKDIQKNNDTISTIQYCNTQEQKENVCECQENIQASEKVEKSNYIEDTAIDLPPDCVEIICPECNQEVIIDSSNICPNCGCEFEEIEKHFRLTRIGTLFGMVSSSIYLLSLILLRFLTQPDHIKENSLFYMDSFRFTSFNTIISMVILAALLTISYIFITIAENNLFYKISVIASLVLSVTNMYVLYATELQNSFYILPILMLIITLIPIMCSIFCFADMFISPKSKINR